MTVGIPWSSVESYVPGDVRFKDSIAELGWKWFLGSAVPTLTGDALTAPSEDQPFGSLLSTKPSAGVVSIDAAALAVERVAFTVDPQPQPAWDQWLNDGGAVGVRFDNYAGGGNMLVRVSLERLSDDGTLQEGGPETADQSVIGEGAFVFAPTGPSGGWGTSGDPVAVTDTLRLLVRYENTHAALATSIDIITGNASSYVEVLQQLDVAGGTQFFYSVAAHINKDPGVANYQDDFWYPLPEDADGNALLEVPTPYLQADLADLQFVQAGDIVTITHRDYTPHELIRNEHETMTFGRWTMLPISYKPEMTAPSGFVSVDAGLTTGGQKDVQYKVTAVSKDTGNESIPGPGGSSAGGGAGSFSADEADAPLSDAYSTTADISVAVTGHGLLTGDEIYIIAVETVDPDRAQQTAVELLQDTVQTIDKTNDDNFTLRGTTGLLATLPSITDPDDPPALQITYNYAYVEYVGIRPPKAASGRRVEFSWDPVDGAQFYNIYRRIKDEDGDGTDADAASKWGFLDSTTGTAFADVGEETAGVVTVSAVDEETPPPDYSNPFVYNMWPRSSAYHKQRQWFAGFNARPRQAWGSRIGDFRSFSTRTILQDDDAVRFDIASEEANEIRHLSSLGRLTIFTSGVVWVVNGDSSGDITPTSIGLESMTYEGATGVRAEGADDSLLYVQARGSTIREIRYNLENGGLSGYQGRDLTVYAPRLFDGYQFKDIAVTRIPHSIVWVVRDDGTLLGLTYIVEHEVWAWHRHDTQGGAVLSVATIPEENVDVLYAVVRRDIGGVDTYFVERMDVRTIGRAGIDTRVDSFFVDSGVTYNGANTGDTTLTLSGGTTWEAGETGLTLTASADLFDSGDPAAGVGWRLVGADGEEVEVDVTAYTSATVVTVTLLTDAPASTQATATADWVKMLEDITGLDHLEGETVVALADNNVIEDLTVSSGTVVLARPYGVVHVGLSITADIEMLDLDLAQDTDTISDKQKRVAKATLFLEDTRGIQVGIDGSNLQDLQLEHGDEALDLITGKRTIRFPTSYNNEGRVLIRQSQPLPAEITAIVRHVEMGEN